MAKFPTEVERSVTVKAPVAKVYEFFWDVVGSSSCIEGIDTCKKSGQDRYRFVFQERSAGLVSLVVRYTCKYEGNGVDEIRFESVGAKDDNTDVSGRIHLKASGPDATKVTLWQRLAPETPVPTLLQGLIRSTVEKEASEAVRLYLASAKHALEGRG